MKIKIFFCFIISIIGLGSFRSQVPNACLFYQDYLYISKFEVSNFQYLNTILDPKVGKALYEEMLPDSSAWNSDGAFMEPYVSYYMRHPAFSNYPVVNITKKQARLFCSLVQGKLNEIYLNDEKSEIAKVKVRLPTAAEWNLAVFRDEGWHKFPWGNDDLVERDGKRKGMLKANIRPSTGDYMGFSMQNLDNSDVTAPVGSYGAYNGIFDAVGNVAEIVEDDDAVFGGSWKNGPDEINPRKGVFVNLPSADVGFRYVVEVVEWKSVKTKNIKLNRKFFRNYFVGFGDSLFVGKYEVSNQLWQQFELETGIETKVPDWESKVKYFEQFASSYQKSGRFGNYPAVAKTIEEIETFCNWFAKHYYKATGEEIIVRLPDVSEWVLFSGILRKGGTQNLLNPNANFKESDLKNGLLKCDVYQDSLELFLTDSSPNFIPVNSGYLNQYRLYNVLGNVRELVKAEDGFVFLGGSWNDTRFMENIMVYHLNKTNGKDDVLNTTDGLRIVFQKK